MPTYDYRCTDCGLEVEVTHGIHASGPSTCTACGGAMRKALSTPAIHFKGSGWAKKDARAAAKPATAGAASPAGKEAEGKPATPDGAAKPTSDGASTATGSGSGGPAAGDTASAKPTSGADT